MYTPSSSIKSPGVGTREVWIAELRRRGANEPERIVDAYIKYGAQIGYNHDLALSQAIKECAGFTDWKWTENNNPAGIGSTSRDVPGAVFENMEAGITAQYSHQAAYAESADSCPIEKMGDDMADLFNDPRHRIVGHQSHAQIAWWDGRWAVPGNGYAQGVCDIANTVVTDAPDPPAPTPVNHPTELNIVDLMPELTTSNSGGPGYQDDAKVGIIWHYNGPPPNPNARTQYINDSSYHVNKGWGLNGGPPTGDGIMYHYGVGRDADGTPTVFKLREEADVLWHCGAWVPGGNESGIAININIGEGQHADADVLDLAAALGTEIIERRGIDRAMCRGHQEVSPTACPGTLMDDLVIPFRNGMTGGTVVPVEHDDFLHENGYVIGGGFKSIVDNLESVSHQFRMKILGYVLGNEGDGYLLSPEVLPNGQHTGRFHVAPMTVQKFERETLVHDANEPNADWEDVLPLRNRGFLAGYADDPEIAAILINKTAQVDPGHVDKATA